MSHEITFWKGNKRHKEAEREGRRDGERSWAPSDATGSLHSFPPNKARVGQAGEKIMPNCQHSQRLKSLPSPLNKDTFLICSSKLLYKVLSRIWGEIITFLSNSFFPLSYPPYLWQTRQRHLLLLLWGWSSDNPRDKKKRRLSSNISFFCLFGFWFGLFFSYSDTTDFPPFCCKGMNQ